MKNKCSHGYDIGFCPTCDNYGKPYSVRDHFHCWSQDNPPARGIRLEEHKSCCLCGIPYSNSCASSCDGSEIYTTCPFHGKKARQNTPEEWVDEFYRRWFLHTKQSTYYPGFIYPEVGKEVETFIRTELQKEYERGRKEEEKDLLVGIDRYVDTNVDDSNFNRPWLKAHLTRYIRGDNTVDSIGPAELHARYCCGRTND